MCIDMEHPEGMLDRDQRTVRARYAPEDAATTATASTLAPLASPSPSQALSLVARHLACWRTRKSRTTWRIAQKLKRVLVFSVYLLSVISLPQTWCAPTNRNRDMTERMNSHPKWINPCGMASSDLPSEGDGMGVADGELLSQIIVQARIALSEADNFKEDYVQNTFNMDFERNHLLWKKHRYDWLPNWEQIPKNLGEKTPGEHLDGLELNKALLDTYEYLQTIAVGLEQIVWDQEDDNGPFYSKFKDTEFKLRALLCEIQVTMWERRMTMRPDVRRDVMTQEYRENGDMSSRYLRDWLIFRDYMNALEYVIEVFEHFKKSL